MALIDNAKDILPLSTIAELLNAKVRTLKMYEDKALLPQKQKGNNKKLYSIDDIEHITFVHYLASVKKINANGIKYILDILKDNMDLNTRKDFFDLINKKMSELSSKDVQEVTSL